jgi:Bacterial Ig-like domain (group 2)
MLTISVVRCSVIVGGLALASTLACSSDHTAPRVPAGIILVPNHPSVPQGLSLKLKATVVDASGAEIRGEVVLFSSSDESVLTVDAQGNMHSVGPLGMARVTADLNGLTTTVDVEVTQRIVSLAVAPESLVINVGLTAFLQVSLKDFTGQDVFPSGQVAFQSGNTSVVTVDQFGNVQAGSTVGQTTIAVAVDTFHVDVPVRVGHIPDVMEITPNSVGLAPGASQQLSVTVRDKAGVTIPSPALSFTSSSPTIFSVSNTGLVTSLGPNGSGTVTVRLESLEAECAVFVGNLTPVSLVHTTQTQASMYEAAVGPTGQMVISAPNGLNARRGDLPAFDLPTSLTTGGMPLGVAVNHAGTRAYVASAGQLSVLDLTNNTALTPVLVPGGGDKFAVVVSGDDQRVYLGTSLYVYVIDPALGQVLDSIQTGAAVFLSLHPTLPRLYVSEGDVREIDLTTRKITRTMAAGGLKEIEVSPDGTELYGADESNGTLRVFSLTTGMLTQTVVIPAGAFGLAVSDRWIVVTTGSGVAVFDRASRFPLSTISTGGTPRRPAIDGTGTTIVVPNEGGWVDFLQ